MSSKRKTGQSKTDKPKPDKSRTESRATSPATSRSDTSNSSKASSPVETPSKVQIDYKFLNISNPREMKAPEARRAVRSFVTTGWHKREQQALAARRAQTVPQADNESDEMVAQRVATFPSDRSARLDLPHRPMPTPSSTEASSSSPSPSGSGAGSPLAYIQELRIEPPEIYPEEWHPYVARILDHYLANMAIESPDLDGPDARGLLRSRFFPFVLTDEALLHTVMLMAVSHYNSLHGPRSHTIDILQLRGMAIREINNALEDPQRATSDQLIAAVAKMASHEALYGDRRIYKTHMTGLLRMVSLRGGLPALGLDGLLERILLWIDSNAGHITGSHIFFDRAAFPTSVRHPRPDPQRFAGGLSR